MFMEVKMEMEKGVWKGKERKMRGTRKWDDGRLVPINLLG
jgi:hypothetical protein